ncbi:MAG: phospho-N-acetylmuramoyl-pentapeptide-transferase [bacterium]
MEYLLQIMFVAFIFSLFIGPAVIKWLKYLKFGQSIRKEGPESHQKKAGIPTMGGILILLSLTCTVLLFLTKQHLALACLLVTVGYGLIGFLDDMIIVVKKRNLGLTAKQKLFGQIVIAGLFAYYIWQHPEISKQILIPGFNYTLDLGYLYIPFVILVMIGTSNAVNLTDGLDGLASGTVIICLLAFLVITLTLKSFALAGFICAVLGSCLGFLWFNCHPAEVFMGDTGSLALGGACAGIAVLTGTELLLFIIGGIFVMETVSVILQVSSFKLTGKRIFRMSPIHHHFELLGWKETKVVYRFYLLAVLFALIGLWLFFM